MAGMIDAVCQWRVNGAGLYHIAVRAPSVTVPSWDTASRGATASPGMSQGKVREK